jgi:predicted deacylase
VEGAKAMEVTANPQGIIYTRRRGGGYIIYMRRRIHAEVTAKPQGIMYTMRRIHYIYEEEDTCRGDCQS